MSREMADQIADAVLYEGYMLYPYRPSALKNRQRWSFGILYPPAYPEVGGGTERSALRSECLLEAHDADAPRVRIRARFLQLASGTREADASPDPAPSLPLRGQEGGTRNQGLQRAAEFEWEPLTSPWRQFEFRFPGSGGGVEASHASWELRGTVSARSEPAGKDMWKLTIEIANRTSLPPGESDREGALLRSLLSAHSILTVRGGGFVSLLDPPESLREAAGACRNEGNLPVLVGTGGERDTLLCSPILLYDYPQIAPESAGDFYDATEIDEMLTLRVLTLSEREKDEIRQGDDQVRRLLQRTEATARQQLARTHGAIRSLRPTGDR